MNNLDLLNKIKAKFPSVEEFKKENYTVADGVLTLNVPSDKFLELSKELKNDQEFDFDSLMCLSGVDYPDRFETVYHLSSIDLKHKITLKVALNKTAPKVESVTGIWETANWHEREAYDMFGIIFNNHPDLRRILTVEGTTDFPLRKDYAAKPDQYD